MKHNRFVASNIIDGDVTLYSMLDTLTNEQDTDWYRTAPERDARMALANADSTLEMLRVLSDQASAWRVDTAKSFVQWRVMDDRDFAESMQAARKQFNLSDAEYDTLNRSFEPIRLIEMTSKERAEFEVHIIVAKNALKLW